MNLPKYEDVSEYTQDIIDQAVHEYHKELHLLKVQELKEKLIARQHNAKWWHKLFPFTIKIERRK
jgi:hypothetical protein